MADDHNYNFLNVQETKELHQFYQILSTINVFHFYYLNIAIYKQKQ